MNQHKTWSYYQTKTPEIFRSSAFRLYYLARLLRRGQRVLNVGIGGGLFERYAYERGVDVHTLDPDLPSLYKYANAGVSRMVAGQLEGVPFRADTFDKVVVSEVLEHLSIEAMRLALAEIRRVLVPGGEIIGTVPCEENLGDGMVVCPHCGEIFHKVGHQQSFSTRTIARELEGYFERVECFERAFMAKSETGWKEQAVDIVRNLLVRSGVMTREKQLVFLARKQFS